MQDLRDLTVDLLCVLVPTVGIPAAFILALTLSN